MSIKRPGRKTGSWLGVALALMLCAGCTEMSGLSAPSVSAAASGTGESSQPVDDHSDIILHLPYKAEDSLDPYQCRTEQNFYISQLLYDPLFRLSINQTPEAALAEKAEQATEGRWRVSLRRDAVFSDGSPVTAADVVRSFWLALENPSYQAGLRDVSEVNELDARTVEFVLTLNDVYFPCALVFPIVQREGAPLYSGRFLPAGETPNVLVPNTRYSQPPGRVKRIELSDVPDEESAIYSLKSGKVDLLFSDMRSVEGLGTNNSFSMVQLNNLVFMGINSKNRMLDNPIIKNILSELVDRAAISRRAYLGQATTVEAPLNPAFFVTGADNNVRPSLDSLNGRLDEAGCDQRDEAGYRLIGNERMSFRLLCNNDSEFKMTIAQVIKECYNEVGIEVIIQSMPFDAYMAALAEGAFDLYIGEIRLGYNMNLNPLLNPEGAAGYGVKANPELLASYREFRADAIGADVFCRDFAADMPFVPLLYRRGVLLHARDFFAKIVATEQDIFYNILTW